MGIKITLAAHSDDGLIEEHEFIINEGACEDLQKHSSIAREMYLDLVFEENDLAGSMKESVLEYLEDLDQ